MTEMKEAVLLTALRLFARDGYEATPVSAIAGALGVSKGALYRHYASKRDIFDQIVARMAVCDAERARAFSMPEGTLAQMQSAYADTTIKQIIAYAKGQFRYWAQDEFAALFRKMLTLEQYRSAEMMRLYQQYLAAGPLDYMTDLLRCAGLSQPRERAAAFHAPLFLLLSVYDGAQDKAAVTALTDDCLTQLGKALGEEKRCT